MGRWAAIVGPEVAAHATPQAFEDGELVVAADSTAWATQIRLLAPTLLARLAEELGAGVVTSVTVRGPSAPSWKKGLLAVRGRGPRDTYG
jgi:predicted nucleic acid-binding Zn ribbon protein